MGRLKAATFIETIIAAVIIIALFVVVNMVFLSIGSSTTTLQKVKAKKIIDLYAAQASREGRFTDITEQQGSLQVRQNVVEFINKKAVKLNFTVLDKGGHILEQQQRILLIP